MALSPLGEPGEEAPSAPALPRVLILSDVYFPRVNGVSTSIASFRGALERRGLATRLIAPAYGDEGADRSIVRLAGPRVPFDPEDRFVPAGRFLRAGRREAPFDVLHVQTPFSAHRAGVRLARERGVRVVETWHTDFEHYFEHYLPLVPAPVARAVARRIARRIAREVDHLLVPSTAIAEGMARLAPATPITVLPTGLAADEFEAGDGRRFRARLGIDPARPVLVTVGRLAHEKNLDFLVDVVDRGRREIPALLWLVAGEGPARPSLERQIARRGLVDQVRLVGNLERRRELPDAYRAGDLFVFASKTETQGLVLLESMALGVPVVALAEQGTVDLMSRGRGAVTAPDDPAAFAATVVATLRDRERLETLSREGREEAARWSADAQAAKLVALYSELTEGGRVAAAQARSR